jgi:hypothetical protein
MIAGKCQTICHRFCVARIESNGGLFIMEENKVLGIPVHKYAKLCYILILVSAGFGILTSLLALIGMYVPGTGIFGLIGLIGLALVVTGWLAFTEKFSALDISHFRFLTFVFILFFVLYIIFFNALAGFGPVGAFIVFLIAAAQFAVFLAGFQAWKAGQEATVDNVKLQLKDLRNVVSRKSPPPQ